MVTSSVTGGRLPGKPPRTHAQWESTLVAHFLAIGPDGDASDIHSLEITPETLTAACGLRPDQAEEVEAAFKQLFASDSKLPTIMRTGDTAAETIKVPNCFVYLALTLFVDTLLDGTYGSAGQFRDRLASWIGIDNSFGNLSGVNVMWERLSRWLERRIKSGLPFRKLVLPDAGGWHQIGRTKRLSFPNRSDVRFMQKFVDQHRKDLDNPPAVINAFRGMPGSIHVSVGLHDAFDEFQTAYFRAHRALADHRFWRLLIRARANAAAGDYSAIILQLVYDENEEMEFLIGRDDGCIEKAFSRLGDALADVNLARSDDLGAAVRRGFFFFRQAGVGRWQAESDLKRCVGQVLLATEARRFRTAIGMRLGPLVQSSGWLLTERPHTSWALAGDLPHIGMGGYQVDSVYRPAFSGGIKTHGAWLGLPNFLPSLGVGSEKIKLRYEPHDDSESRQVGIDGMQLTSDGPLDGVCVVEPALSTRETAAPWRLSSRFLKHAIPHVRFTGARYDLEPMNDWHVAGEPSDAYCTPPPLAWSPESTQCDDLLEALYADGASGWEEAQLVSLLRRASPSFESSPWPMLRCLQDSAILQPRLRNGWRGRAWTLVPPQLVELETPQGPLVLVEGALCNALLNDFCAAVAAVGGTSYRNPGLGSWSPATITAAIPRVIDVAQRLNWPGVSKPTVLLSRPLALETTAHRATSYSTASRWDWDAGRFTAIKPGVAASAIDLTRCTHSELADHDVYRLATPRGVAHFLSRTSAIVAAYAAARRPLFHFDGKCITRLSKDGGLPALIATALRRLSLTTPSIDDGQYCYAATAENAKWLSTLLPGCLSGLPAAIVPSSTDTLSRARRSGGHMRAIWRDGQLTITP
jgi:hypothetical protein